MSFKVVNTLSDPTDFKPTKVPKLYELDSLLRCHICKEFMVAPMLTSCGHSFCSMCIRKYLIHTPKCPICSQELRESHLNRNILIEQVVMSYKEVRTDLLEAIAVDPQASRKGKMSGVLDQEVIDVDDFVSDSYEDDDVQIIQEQHTKKRKTDPPTSTGHGIDLLFKRKKQEPKRSNVEMAECPICQRSIPLRDLQTTHIDLCLSGELLKEAPAPPAHAPPAHAPTPPQSDTRSPSVDTSILPAHSSASSFVPTTSNYFQPKEPTTKFQKLTKLDFTSLSNSMLKSKLLKLELPITGTRTQWETRYNEYLIIWNANCDSVSPRNPRVLRKRLSQWESTVSYKAKKGDNQQLDQEGWKELIRQARSTLPKRKSTNSVRSEVIEEPMEAGDSRIISIPESKDNSIVITSQEERFFID